jgi:hypothetical protein
VAVADFTSVCGYVQYRTLGLEDRRMHFGLTAEPGVNRMGVYAPVNVLSAQFQPNDT